LTVPSCPAVRDVARCDSQQFAGARYIGLACGTGEQAVMADTMEMDVTQFHPVSPKI
jgi:hypothetical protein